ncbi:exodeoxyribonuclease V subunit gamma [Nocardioides albus]|uniref:RecBCD enzyme subunit RecC n=1 Tax=Nocardioides albus TaxID=1841 RepID=A0A7W5A6B6_9ACTN|nr:exodeoxyribonuclease V subunit gamma [Nocardioides albus]MBB3090508.1 exodeoxyribonuclease V gamma subunit [Nocardioides albus]GGU24412.1 RecBCD enzyme subunit RecC [Nocardioides albus]
MVVHLHRAPRTDLLADSLGELLSVPSEDPFATEVVVVPARGVERWLSQRLSHRLGAAAGRTDGICAAVDFRSPWSLFAEVVGTGDEDPWAPESLTWPVLAAIDASLDEPWARSLALHLGHGDATEEGVRRRGRRLSLARRLARLFAAYADQRPAVVADWSAGRDTDGLGGEIAEDLAWQPPLWRAVSELVGGPTPVERQAATVARLKEKPREFELPERVSLFGHTRLSVTDIELVAALGEHREVHLWLPHPSEALWEALAGLDGTVARTADRSHDAVGHPLLATLGRDTRELQRGLAGIAPQSDCVGFDTLARPRGLNEVAPTSDGGLLGWLQEDIRGNTVGESGGRVIVPGDRSIQVHACHGIERQVEVLREVLLGLLEDDPTLEPRDVLVMCPDIETFAPLIEAGFGLGEMTGETGHPGHRLRVKLADRSLTRTNPLLDVATRLLDLAGGRAGVSDVLDLAHLDPVRRRFGLNDDALEQLEDWAKDAGIRWGFDAEHREPFGLETYVANTWRFGMDRILTGVAMSEDSATWLDTTLPLDDVGSGSVELAGKFAELVDRLQAVTDELAGVHPLEHWLKVIEEGVAALTSVSVNDDWQSGQVTRELSQVRDAAKGHEVDELRLPDVRALLGARLAGRATRANFRTGTLTVSTLVPMRSVPHRVVCLLGIDDGVFPRVGITDGDDLLARDPQTGERDLRSEDRQLFLDALLAATETLVVTYTGANEYSGQPRPPAVPLGELLDALDATAVCEDGRPVSEMVTTRHPLQPFDPRNLTPGALVADHPFSFDRAAEAGAVAALSDRVEPPELLPAPLAPTAAGDLTLEELLAFYRAPVRAFFRDRLELSLPRDDDPLSDALPVELDGLGQWSVGDRLLHDLLAGMSEEQAVQQEWRRGVLPPKWLGWRILTDVITKAKPIAAEALRVRHAGISTGQARAVDVEVDLGGGRRLTGTVPQVFGDRLAPVTYSRLGAKQRIESWVQLVALAAADEDRAWSAWTLGRPGNSRSRTPFGLSQLGPLDHTAIDVLRDLVRLRDRGLTAPLPLPLKTSFAYARQRRTQAGIDDALYKAGWEWNDGRFEGEESDVEQVRAWGTGSGIPGLGDPPGSGEEFDGETSRFGALAMRVWSPLLTAEQGSW